MVTQVIRYYLKPNGRTRLEQWDVFEVLFDGQNLKRGKRVCKCRNKREAIAGMMARNSELIEQGLYNSFTV